MTNLPPSPDRPADDAPSPYRAAESEPATPISPEAEAEDSSESMLEPAMTDAPASPYRAADAGAPTVQPGSGAQQQPGNLGQFYPQYPDPYGQYPAQPGPFPQDTVPPGPYPQGPSHNGQFSQYPAPYGYGPGSAAPPRRGNGPGLTSLIFAIVAALIVFVSFGRASPLLFAVPGVVFGAIGMLLPHRPRGLALGGIITSLATIILAIVVTVATSLSSLSGSSSGLDGSADQPPRDEPTASASPTPVESFGAPLGTVFALTDTNETAIFTAKVTASVLDANHLVLPVEGNSLAPPGLQWAMVTVEVTRLGASTLEPSHIAVEYVSDSEVYTAADPVAAAPSDELNAVAENLEIGASGSGVVVVAIPLGRATGSWTLQYRDSLAGGTSFYSQGE